MSVENLVALWIDAQPVLLSFAVRAGVAIAILFAGRLLAGFAKRLLKRTLTRAQVEPTLIVFAGNILFYGLMAFVVLAALNQIGIETTSLVAVLGAAGLAIGLALQGSLANFAAGILIVIFHPFRVGDVIEASGHVGVVADIQLFTTAIATADNRKVIVPNAQLTENTLVNVSTLGQRRIDLVASVDYSADIDRVKEILHDVVSSDERILSDPEPMIGLLEMGESSLDFAVRPWVLSADYLAVRFAVQETLKKRLDDEGISIPFPQRDIHLFTTAETATESN